jgi:hypothetical protein
MQTNSDVIYNIIGQRPVCVRPPYLSADNRVVQTLSSWGYTVVNANLDTRDFEFVNSGNIIANEHAVVDNTVYQADARAQSFISLNHDFTPAIDQWIEEFVYMIRQRGFRFVTVSECVGRAAYDGQVQGQALVAQPQNVNWQNWQSWQQIGVPPTRSYQMMSVRPVTSTFAFSSTRLPTPTPFPSATPRPNSAISSGQSVILAFVFALIQ